MKKGLLFSILFIYSPVNFAELSFPDAIYPELATSTRAVAMGNANVAEARNTSAVFYNPAGLARVQKSRFNLGNIFFQTNVDFHGLGYSGDIMDYPSSFGKKLTLNGIRKALLGDSGKYLSSDFQILPNYVGTFFSAGYLYAARNIITMGKEADAPLEYADRFDHGPYVGFGIPLLGKFLKIGMSATYLFRKEAEGESDRETEIVLQSKDYDKGKALIATAGATIQLPFWPYLTASIVRHNAFNQAFSKDSSIELDKIQPQMDLGFSAFIPIGTLAISLEVDLKDINHRHADVDSSRKFLAGMELNFFEGNWVRLGFGDGYLSGGMRFRSKSFEFDLSTWGVHGSDRENTRREDRRFAVGFSHFF